MFLAWEHPSTGGEGWAAAVLRLNQTQKNWTLKNKYCVDIMISIVLRDLAFSRNHLLNSADD
jgi:hypothetical protein